MEAVAEEEKVFVVVPAEPRAGRSTMSWALTHLCGGGATTVVVTHVHVPPQMIPVSTCSSSSPIHVSGRPAGLCTVRDLSFLFFIAY
jgi:hypothetical protein